MPNVTRLRLESTTEDDVMVDFLAEIAFLYRQNMQKFECFVEGYLPQLHNAEKLKHIDMSLANWEFIPGRSIYPSSLKYLRMRAVNVQFDWNVFSSAIHPHNACFDQLRSLILYGDIREYSKRMFNEEITLALAFPALEFLAIRYIRLTPKHIKSTMLGPLNQLDFSGYSSDALRFIKHKHTHLKKLTLNFERGLEHDDAKFVTNSNAIFSNTSQIAKVGCNIIWGSVWFDFSNIHWKYVTHLGVHANFELYDLFHAVRGMTSLTSLVISIVHLGESNLGRAVKRIEEEKGTCSARVPCKVKTVTLDYGNGYHNVINLRADRQDWFSMAEAIFSLSV
ncbi:hypothetical protein LPJ76_002547 [Coemansia sp. RSA 638]|nr:hypothetical protein LPJ76_002547 [Coemansia sp. RSA 638]